MSKKIDTFQKLMNETQSSIKSFQKKWKFHYHRQSEAKQRLLRIKQDIKRKREDIFSSLNNDPNNNTSICNMSSVSTKDNDRDREKRD